MPTDDLQQRFFKAAARFRYVETLGRGRSGAVYLVIDKDWIKTLAVKVFAPAGKRRDPDLLRRFEREVALNQRIEHPGIVRMFGTGVAGGIPFIEMEYVRGRTLRAILDDEGEMGLEPQRALGIIREAAIATAAAHGAGILHRDLKPSNLIVREKGGVSILDFGFAREQSPDGLRLTHASQILGTPQYMSPEQALGEDATERTDVYALGIIAFEVVTGHVPFQAANAVALALKHLHEPVPDDLQLFPGFSRQARAAIIRALAKNPADRFQTALAFSRALSDS